jgi:rod shape-determining protein MreC
MAASRERPALLILVGAVLLTILQLTGILQPLTRPVLGAIGPVLTAINSAGAATLRFATFVTPGRLARENGTLRTQVASLIQQNSTLATRAQEAEAIGELDQRLKPLKLPFIVSRILTRAVDPTSLVVTLDRGSLDGVAVGDAVLSSTGFLLGRVVAVTPDSCQALPLTDPRSRITVAVQTAGELLGLAEGDRGLRVLLTNVKRDAELTVGQSVITAGVDPGVPHGIPVGSVETITTRPADLFQGATVLLGVAEVTAGPVAIVTLPR